jgi:hypothetical protein
MSSGPMSSGPVSAPIEADYIIVGAGATGMAFADTLIQHSQATVAIIDRHHRPGGHWNDAYPFVRLHLPSHYYGVASTPLERGPVQPDGLNAGLLPMASGSEILAYYDHVMVDVLQASGRVTYHPLSDYADGAVIARLTGQRRPVIARKRLVNATYTQVPSTHARGFTVADGVTCLPINTLATLPRFWQRYCIIGSGKTGIDACLFLLGNGVSPERIQWIMPRDAWWIDRAKLQWSDAFFEASVGFAISQMEAASQARDPDDLFLRFEAAGTCHRLDPRIRPTIYPSATISVGELAELRRIKDIVRLGRVQALQPGRIELEHGAVSVPDDCLFVDCSAAGIPLRAPQPVFASGPVGGQVGGTITLQPVRALRWCLSGAAIAYIEATFADDATKNALCTPVPMPRTLASWAEMMTRNLANQTQWAQHSHLMQWVADCRLDGVAALLGSVPASDTHRRALIDRMRSATRAAAANLPALLAS